MERKKIPLYRARSGMILADSVYLRSVCLLSEGTILKEKIISLLRNYNIKWVIVNELEHFIV